MADILPPQSILPPPEEEKPLYGQITDDGKLLIKANLKALSENAQNVWTFYGFMHDITEKAMLQMTMRAIEAKKLIAQPSVNDNNKFKKLHNPFQKFWK